MADTTTKKILDPATRVRLEAAVKELFSLEDFHQVNMRDIARKAGVGLNTIYLHYDSKERLLFYFINEWIAQLDSKLADHLQGLEDVKEKIRKCVWVILDFYDKNSDIGRIVLLTVPFKTWITDETFKQKELSTRIIDLFREGQKKGLLNTNIPVEIMFDVCYGAIHRLVYMWIYLKKKESLISYAAMYFDMIWRAIENPNTDRCP
ncbi:MAG: TetR/AcrR family transcriptional regulator [Syntrophales bacterium]|nr:TetR/AcrR family transcriptional regulator [Syntrophales bacterium]